MDCAVSLYCSGETALRLLTGGLALNTAPLVTTHVNGNWWLGLFDMSFDSDALGRCQPPK